MASQITIHPLPGTFQDHPLYTWVSGGFCDRWPQVCAWAAWQFEADEDEIDTREIYFGPDGDDNYREALTVRGEIVGVFTDALTADDWVALLAADAAERAPAVAVSLPLAAE